MAFYKPTSREGKKKRANTTKRASRTHPVVRVAKAVKKKTKK